MKCLKHRPRMAFTRIAQSLLGLADYGTDPDGAGPVAGWVSLQYYGSSVAPEVFGAGNKVLHNVVGGVGVLEGNCGPLRTGLTLPSVLDGEKLVHDPLRVTVCIVALAAAISNFLFRHTAVRDLFVNTWLHLYTVNDVGRLRARHSGDLKWESTRWNVYGLKAAAA